MMRTPIFTLTIAISMAFCCVNVFAMDVPTDTVVQNLDGQQQMVKTFTLPPEQDAQDIIEESIEYDGYTYTFADIVKNEITYNEQKDVKQTVTVETGTNDLAEILSKLQPEINYDDGSFSGILTLDHTSINTEASGYASKGYTVTETKEIGGLDRNDPSYVPPTTTKNGQTLTLSNVEWVVQGTSMVDEALLPSSYMAVATYSANYYKNVATGYITTVDYTGKVSSNGVSGIVYTVTYLGEKNGGFFPSVSMGIVTGIFSICLILGAAYLVRWNNVFVYIPDKSKDEYKKIGALHISKKRPAIDLKRLKYYPEGEVAIEIKRRAARKLLGRQIPVLFRDFRSFFLVDNDCDCWATYSSDDIDNLFELEEEEVQV